MQILKLVLIGYDCPIGRYPAPAVPIIRDSNNEYKAVYLDNNLELFTDPISSDSKFHRLSDLEKKKFEQFDFQKHRIFAVSENDIRFYKAAEQLQFFTGLLSDKSFAYDDPFVRISLAEDTGDAYIIYHELGACEEYLQKYDPDLLPFLEQEMSRLREIIEPLRESKPLPKNRELVHKKLGVSTGQGELIFS